jgi:ribosomal protein S18 acetylase RimI-like enzyme
MELTIPELYQPKQCDIDRLARVAANAFVGDPSMKYQLGGRNPSERQLYHYFSVVLRTGFPYYSIFASSEALDGFIVMLRPGVYGTPPVRFLLYGGWKLPFVTCPDVLRRLSKYEKHCHEIRREAEAGDAWYILMLAVDTAQQGKGHASRLLKSVLHSLDARAEKCYLETHKKSNVDIYSHFGFHTTHIDTVPDGIDTQYAMLRMPQALIQK